MKKAKSEKTPMPTGYSLALCRHRKRRMKEKTRIVAKLSNPIVFLLILLIKSEAKILPARLAAPKTIPLIKMLKSKSSSIIAGA
jgi:hypothetical protein